MTLKEQLKKDLADAMRARDEQRKSVIRMALADIATAELDQGVDLEDADFVALLRKQANQREDTIEELRQTDRADMLAAEEAELAILEQYLPQMLSREQIVAEAQQVIDQVGATSMKDMGPVMGQLMGKLKGRADGREVNAVVRELLSS